MSDSDRAAYILSFIILFCVTSFLTGASFLDEEIIPTIPNGNLLVVAGLLSCALLGRILSWTVHWLHRLNAISIILALSWYPLGMLLSGNTRLNFVNDAQDSIVFDLITTGTIGWCLLLLLLSFGIRAKGFLKRKFFRG